MARCVDRPRRASPHAGAEHHQGHRARGKSANVVAKESANAYITKSPRSIVGLALGSRHPNLPARSTCGGDLARVQGAADGTNPDSAFGTEDPQDRQQAPA